MIALASDHAAVELKKEIITMLQALGLEYKDFGTMTSEAVDYPDYALKAAQAVARGECEKAIIVCGTGIGVSIVANKVKKIRAALCCDVFSAKSARQHNDANVLAMGARVIGVGLALEIAKAFLTTPFSNEQRHKNRIQKITQIESI